MADIEKLKGIFKELNIEYSEQREGDTQIIRIEEGIGYSWFYAEFRFDVNGKFVEYGIWE